MFVTAGCSIKLWDAQNYTLHQEIPSGRVGGLTWAQNGQCIASLGESASEISLYAVNSKSTANIGVVRTADSPSCLKFPCRSSHYLGVGSKDGNVALWNLKSKSQKKAFVVTDSPISRIAFSHNDSHIAAASKGSVYLLSTMNNSVNGPFKIFDQAVTEVVYSMVKKSLLGCCSENGSVSLFDANTSKVLHTFTNAHASPVSSVSFSPINELLMISVGYDKKFVCYSIQTKKQILTHKASAPLTSAALLPGCQHIALGAMTGEVFIHDLRTIRKPLATLNAHDKAVTSILLQPATKHIAEGSSSDAKTAKLRRKTESTAAAPSKSSSEVPPQENPTESVARGKLEDACTPVVDPSHDVLSAIFSPVRPSEQLPSVNHELGEEQVPNYDTIMDNVLSPVRSSGLGPKDDNGSFSSKKMTLFQEIFSPVRTSQNDVSPHDLHDVFSPVRIDTNTSGTPCNITVTDVSSPLSRNEAQLYPDSSNIAKMLNRSIDCAEEQKEATDSLQNSTHKENQDPNKTSDISSSSSKDITKNAGLTSVETPLPKMVLSPAQQVNESKRTSSAKKSLKKHAVEILEPCLGLPSNSIVSDYTKNQANSFISTMLCEDTPSTPATDDSTNLPDNPNDSPISYEGTQIGSAASHMQVELIRSCMAEVLEDFQDDVNRRMMHLQYIVTKQFLQLKETVQQLQSQHTLTSDVLLENERLRKENARLRANF